MSNRHLPAGQNIQGGAHGADMVGGPGAPRRRQPPPYVPYQQHHQHMNAMYPNYMPYNQPYYGYQPHYQGQHYQNAQYPNAQYQGGQYQAGQYQNGQYPTAQYQNAGMHSPGYVPYQNFARSPPAMPQYIPMSGVSIPPSYTPRPAQQQSPALSNPYQPPAAAPIPPQTPTSTHSSQMIPPPTPPVPQETEPVPPAPAAPVEPVEPSRVPSPPPAPKEPFRAPLPWSSHPDFKFPARAAKSRRRRRQLNADSEALSLPVEQQQAATEHANAPEANATQHSVTVLTPASSAAPSETAEVKAADSPISPVQQRSRTNTATSATSTATNRPAARSSTVPAPAIPSLPKASPKEAKPVRAEKPANGDVAPEAAHETSTKAEALENGAPEKPAEPEPAAEPAPAVKVAPANWADLLRKPAAATASGKSNAVNATNGSASSFSKANASSVAEAIHSFQVGLADQVSFLEPRGLINTGNMCYMNSVLQVLMFCLPFYDFLSQISKRAVHSFKSDTPLIDAMIMFMHEFKTIKSAAGIESLRTCLKNEELERYGDPFTPEFVYEAIRQLPRFASMRRGHQQDAEEFLGFLLQSLDDECTSVLKNSALSDQERRASSGSGAGGEDWLEVGRKQKAAVSRSSGPSSFSPISRIFGGSLRSEFRVPGLKDSITTEPYQPLQLDIGSPDVRNVVDALRGLTRPERLQGDFNSPRGKDVTATKQVFIDTLPPVLILHLKRFQFDAEGNGTVKIWKKIGYPLELEIPREALSRQKRQTYGDDGMPKYRLISVVYHHGKNASGGHYTVDVRRQEGREWIRIDDTVIRRVRSEDIAEGGEEEEIKDNRKDGQSSGSAGNRFGAVLDEEAGDDDGWSKVTSPAGGAKKWSSVANGTSNGSTKAKQVKDNIKDNKVAYLLFYQRV